MKGHADIIQMLIDAKSEMDAQDKVCVMSSYSGTNCVLSIYAPYGFYDLCIQ